MKPFAGAPPSTEVVLVFAKYPRAGRVKTRLARELGDAAAADLYRAFVADLLDTLDGIGRPLAICHWPADAGGDMREWLGEDRRYWAQEGDDLGERMANALARAFRAGFRRAILVGTDLPDLPSSIVVRAFDALARTGVVLGPARDGGYYLIGFCAETFTRDVFRDIPWSENAVCRRTRDRMAANGLAPVLLPVWKDIDTVADLEELGTADRAPRTRARLAALGRLPPVGDDGDGSAGRFDRRPPM